VKVEESASQAYSCKFLDNLYFMYVESCHILYAAAVYYLIYSLSPCPDRGFLICTVIPYHNAAFATRVFWLKEWALRSGTRNTNTG
jgi:hypothetical protein